MSHHRALSLLAAAASAATLLVHSGSVRADDISPRGKGITGGALLGAEVVMDFEAAFGTKPAWAYVLGGVVGAGGGGYVGYLAEQNADPKTSLYMLAGGMALIIPTTVAVLQATSYHPPAEYTEDRPAIGAPVAEPPRPTAPMPGSPAGAVPPPAPGAGPTSYRLHWSAPRMPLPTGVVDFADDGLKLAVPAVEVRPMFTLAEVQKYGFVQHDELRVPLLSGTF